MAHVVIVGAGPAGSSLAYLLARRGVQVTLLERQQGFDREFRGEVLTPSGLDALRQMGLADALEQVPSQDQTSVTFHLNGKKLFHQSFEGEVLEKNPPRAVSQPRLLEMLVAEASKSESFRIEEGASVKALIQEEGRVVGVRVRTQTGEEQIRADLIVGADGRASIVRKQGGFRVQRVSPPMDIIWAKLPCPKDWQGAHAYVGKGHLLLGYRSWDGCLQLGWTIEKGAFGEVKAHGIDHWFSEMEAHVTPELAAHLRAEKANAHKPFFLDAESDCVENWSIPGALLIGDAAHTMSPVGGQGINIALRDSIVAANHLVPELLKSDPGSLDSVLAEIERERMPEVRKIQRLQAFPPRIWFNRAGWGEPVRRVLGQLARSSAVRRVVAWRVSDFAFGVTDVRLRV
ncbi:MAG: FAD-dependent oxidoreductase [Myxococcota bacterium]|nr:FAD-dependent oxidoreductase [Myxococcota bacterium]